MSEKSEKFLTDRGWDKDNPVTGGVFLKGIAELLDEYEAANEASTSHKKALDIDLVSDCGSDTKDLIEHTKRVLDLIKSESGIAVKVLSNRVNKKLEQLK